MSDKSRNPKHAQSRTDTLIGAGTRFEGDITFTGVLRIESEVVGNVTCGADRQGTVWIAKNGVVTGAITAPHVVVAGRVTGSVTTDGSLEVLSHARIQGDATYRDIVVHEGGVIEGLLTPMLPTAVELDGSVGEAQERKPLVASDVARPASPVRQSWFKGGWVTGTLAVAVMGAAAWLWFPGAGRGGATFAHEAAKQAAPELTAAASAPMQAASDLPVVSAAAQTPPDAQVPAAASAPATPPVVLTAASTPVIAPAPVPSVAVREPQVGAADGSADDPKAVTVVRGDDAGKPADFVYVVAGKEAAVLYKKTRSGAPDGTRIDVAHGASKRIPLGKGELLRVEQGRGLQVFYQGRKVASSTLTSGTWMRFVPSA